MSITEIERISGPTSNVDNAGELKLKLRLGGWFDSGCFVGC